MTAEWFKKNWVWLVIVILIIVLIIIWAVRRPEGYHDSNQDGYELGRGLPGRGPRLFEVVHDYPYRRHPHHHHHYW
jgi:hypothetical protein